MHHSTSLRRVARAVALVVLALGVWQGVALAGATGEHATVPVQQFNSFCGSDSGGTVIGSVRFTRSGDKLTVAFKLKGALGKTHYAITLWDGSDCSQIAELGDVYTTANGKGSRTFHTTVGGQSQFFASGHDGSHYNDTLIVTLP
jgi:hypothetical protein